MQVLLAESGSGTAEERFVVVIVVNHGVYTITDIEARLRLSGGRVAKLPIQDAVPQADGADARLAKLESPVVPDTAGPFSIVLSAPRRLAPWDAGIRFISGLTPVQDLLGAGPVVRWSDRWGTRWEHRLGEVQRIRGDEPWEPKR